MAQVTDRSGSFSEEPLMPARVSGKDSGKDSGEKTNNKKKEEEEKKKKKKRNMWAAILLAIIILLLILLCFWNDDEEPTAETVTVTTPAKKVTPAKAPAATETFMPPTDTQTTVEPVRVGGQVRGWQTTHPTEKRPASDPEVVGENEEDTQEPLAQEDNEKFQDHIEPFTWKNKNVPGWMYGLGLFAVLILIVCIGFLIGAGVSNDDTLTNPTLVAIAAILTAVSALYCIFLYCYHYGVLVENSKAEQEATDKTEKAREEAKKDWENEKEEANKEKVLSDLGLKQQRRF